MEFFAETRHSYGRTALFLSGGGAMGKYHFGTMKALYEADLFPRIIVGSSVGGVICCCLAGHPYSEMWKFFSSDPQYKYMINNKMIEYKFDTL